MWCIAVRSSGQVTDEKMLLGKKMLRLMVAENMTVDNFQFLYVEACRSVKRTGCVSLPTTLLL